MVRKCYSKFHISRSSFSLTFALYSLADLISNTFVKQKVPKFLGVQLLLPLLQAIAPSLTATHDVPDAKTDIYEHFLL